MLEKSIDVISYSDPPPVEDSADNGGGPRGIVFEKTNEVPKKKPRLLPGEEVDEGSKKLDMTIDGADGKTGKKNAMTFFPVNVYGKGVGLPYAPEDWPEPGDYWSWRVGNRTTVSGYFRDRYLYPPSRFPEDPSPRRRMLSSRVTVKEFIQSRFPDADADEFLASFSWKIPATKIAVLELTDFEEDKETKPGEDLPCCKAGNVSCTSLVKQDSDSSRLLVCNDCCAEPRYCRDCSCILCGKSVSSDHDGYSYIRCGTLVGGAICGHAAHVNCGIRAYLAGTVGGSIGLDAEYYCRRCNSKVDLVPHAEKVFSISQSLASRESAEMVLNVGIMILRGSARSDARILLDKISSARLMVLTSK